MELDNELAKVALSRRKRLNCLHLAELSKHSLDRRQGAICDWTLVLIVEDMYQDLAFEEGHLLNVAVTTVYCKVTGCVQLKQRSWRTVGIQNGVGLLSITDVVECDNDTRV